MAGRSWTGTSRTGTSRTGRRGGRAAGICSGAVLAWLLVLAPPVAADPPGGSDRHDAVVVAATTVEPPRTIRGTGIPVEPTQAPPVGQTSNGARPRVLVEIVVGGVLLALSGGTAVRAVRRERVAALPTRSRAWGPNGRSGCR